MTSPHLTALLAHLDRAGRDHTGGHRCTDGQWWNPYAGARLACPTADALAGARLAAAMLHGAVHAAAHDDTAAVAVAEGMTGLVLADLPDDGDLRIGWTLTARYAIEALSEHLDRDPTHDARLAAVRARFPQRQESP